MKQKSPTDLLREQMIDCHLLIERLCKLMGQRIQAIEQLLDTGADENDKIAAEERMINMLRALVDAAHKSATFLIAKGAGAADTPAGTTAEEIMAEMTRGKKPTK